MSFKHRRVVHVLSVAVIALSIAVQPASSQRPAFYPDDPIQIDDDMSLDASKVGRLEDSNGYDFVVNTFASPGVRHDVRAANVNTIDEVPDSSWFANRMGRAKLSTPELVRGPDRIESINLEGWKISGPKGSGLQPGFRMTDPEGQLYQIEFDPPSNPEMATGAEIIGTAFYYAFGYHTVEVYIAELDPSTIEILPTARIRDPLVGERRPMTRRDVDDVLRRAARLPNGRYRVLASRFAEGAPLGNFRYYGTRPDDPNDVILHEDRRELRGARVFGAWLNHDDSRGVNSLDMLHTERGRNFVKHYMFDFGSIMGSGTVFAQRYRAGNEYILEWAPGWRTLATLGLYTRDWMHIDYPDVPKSVGRFEGNSFDPVRWRPEYPNTAFDNMRPDDAFWAARIVSRFTDADIRAIVSKARYSDPRATEYITATLIERRNRVLKTWLTAVNPVVDFALSASGELTFANAAVDAGVASAPASYQVSFARFDNTTGSLGSAGLQAGPVGLGAGGPAGPARVTAPPQVLAGSDFVQVEIAAQHPDFPSWNTPVTVHFRRAASGWTLVGVTRLK
jgi:hypothetical protein